MIRRTLVLVLAAYIVLGPGLLQVNNSDLPLVRSWQMYGSVGIGAPYGEFRIAKAGMTIETIPIADTLGLEHIRELQLYPGSGALRRYFHGQAEFITVAASLCDRLDSGQTLSFNGKIAGRRGWVNMQLEHPSLCPGN